MADIANGSACLDIKEYLWDTSKDLTSLPSTMTIFIALYSLIISLGILGNSIVVMSVVRHKSLQSVRNMFIVSLSCSDIVVSLVSGSITPISAFTKVWLFGPMLCKMVPLIQGSALCFSTLTLTAISIDRFILIIYPTKRSIQKHHAVRMIIVNWIIATSISLPMFFKQKLMDYGNFCGEFCAEDWGEGRSRSAYGLAVTVITFCFPFLVITFCYSMISLRLRRGILLKNSNPVAQSDQRRAALKRRIAINRMLVTVVFVFILCWTPTVVFNFLRDFEWLPEWVKKQEYLCGLITHFVSMSSTVWNPTIYALLNEQFRAAFREYLTPCRQMEDQIPDDGDSGTTMPSKMSRLGSRIQQRCSTVITGVLFDLKGRDPHLVRNSGDIETPRNRSSLPIVRTHSLKSALSLSGL